MINIIKADLFRIFKRKGIYIITFIMIAITFIAAYSLTPPKMGLNLGNDHTNQLGLSDEWYQELLQTDSLSATRDIILEHGNYEADVSNLSKNSSLYYLFIVLVVFIISCDFTNGTIKNTVSTNISKKKYYFSKLILALGLGTGLIVLNTYFSHFINLAMNGSRFVTSLSNLTLLMLRQLPMLYGIISVLVMITVITRRTGIFNGITIPLIMVMQLVFVEATNLLHLSDDVLNYEFETVISNLCYNPASSYMIKAIVVWSGILVLTTAIGYTYFKKRDI